MANPKDLNKEQMKALMRMNPTLEDTAAFFEVSARTIDRFLKKHFGVTFVEFREQNMVHTRLSLIRKALHRAENGSDTMLIFCLKNLCGWSDKKEIIGSDSSPITIQYKPKSQRDDQPKE